MRLINPIKTMLHAVLIVAIPLITAATANTTGDDQRMFPTLARYQVSHIPETLMQEIATKFEVVERINDQTFAVLVPHGQRSRFLQLAPQAQLIQENENAALEILAQTDQLNGYRNFDGLVAELQSLAAEHPDLVKLENYGTSTQGRPLLAVKVSDNVHQDEDEPELLVDGATHGDEIISVEVVMGILHQLVDGYGQDSEKTAMIDDHEIFFIPVVSPDSYVKRSRYVDGEDPNRQYPWPDKPNRSSIRPIKALIDFFHTRHFAGLLSFHAHGEMIMYPWAYTTSTVPAEDHRRFIDIAQRMSATNGYRSGQISKILYAAPGSSADYYYWQKRTLAYGIEVAKAKAPPFSQVQQIVDENTVMVWEFIRSF